MRQMIMIPHDLGTVDAIVGSFLNNTYFETTARREVSTWGVISYTVTSGRFGDAGRFHLSPAGSNTKLECDEPVVPTADRLAALRERGQEHSQLKLHAHLVDGLRERFTESVSLLAQSAIDAIAGRGQPAAAPSPASGSGRGWNLFQEYTFDGEAKEVCRLFGCDPLDDQLLQDYINVKAMCLLPLTNVRYVLRQDVTGANWTDEHAGRWEGVLAFITLAQQRPRECTARLYLAPREVWESALGGAEKEHIFAGALADEWNRKIATWRPAAPPAAEGGGDGVAGRPAVPDEPKGNNLDDWFAYYDNMKNRGMKFTLKDIARETGYSHGHVRQRHGEYMAEHGTDRI